MDDTYVQDDRLQLLENGNDFQQIEYSKGRENIKPQSKANLGSQKISIYLDTQHSCDKCDYKANKY